MFSAAVHFLFETKLNLSLKTLNNINFLFLGIMRERKKKHYFTADERVQCSSMAAAITLKEQHLHCKCPNYLI